jgi:hypothetical protein
LKSIFGGFIKMAALLFPNLPKVFPAAPVNDDKWVQLQMILSTKASARTQPSLLHPSFAKSQYWHARVSFVSVVITSNCIVGSQSSSVVPFAIVLGDMSVKVIGAAVSSMDMISPHAFTSIDCTEEESTVQQAWPPPREVGPSSEVSFGSGMVVKLVVLPLLAVPAKPNGLVGHLVFCKVKPASPPEDVRRRHEDKRRRKRRMVAVPSGGKQKAPVHAPSAAKLSALALAAATAIVPPGMSMLTSTVCFSGTSTTRASPMALVAL